MRVCIIYDCLYPWTIGGAERWYRHLAEAHARNGTAVTYLTLRQWDANQPPLLPGVQIVTVGPRMALYAQGRRRILPPLLFGIGVFLHMARHGRRYDVVHTASFPFFSLLAAALVRPFARYRIAVDWHEVWTRAYWRQYLGRLGAIGWFVQWLCAQVPQTAFSFSHLHQHRAEALGLAAVTLLEGEHGDEPITPVDASDPPFVLYAGRMIAEKRVPLLVDALAVVMRDDPVLRAELIGRGPELETVRALVERHGLTHRIALPGFVDAGCLADRQARAAVMVLPSEREGYGLVVVESASRGVPVVVVAGTDNAATELVAQGQNGFVAPLATPADLALAIARALAGGAGLRRSVSDWYARNSQRLSFASSFAKVIAQTRQTDRVRSPRNRFRHVCAWIKD